MKTQIIPAILSMVAFTTGLAATLLTDGRVSLGAGMAPVFIVVVIFELCRIRQAIEKK